MNFQKRRWFFLAIGIAVIGSLVLPIKKMWQENFHFGRNFNSVRDTLGIPKIEDNWILKESNIGIKYWIDPDTTVKVPSHHAKVTRFDINQIDEIGEEEDDFYYDPPDSLAFLLIVRYEFKTGKWNSEFASIRKGRRAKIRPLTLAQADSVLNKWHLHR